MSVSAYQQEWDKLRKLDTNPLNRQQLIAHYERRIWLQKQLYDLNIEHLRGCVKRSCNTASDALELVSSVIERSTKRRCLEPTVAGTPPPTTSSTTPPPAESSSLATLASVTATVASSSNQSTSLIACVTSGDTSSTPPSSSLTSTTP